MSPNPIEEILKMAPAFSGLDSCKIRKILKFGAVKEYKKNQAIYLHGQPPTALYILISGKVATSVNTPTGPKILEILHRGKIFGIISTMTQEPHSVNAYALFDSLILEISQENFGKLLYEIPELSMIFSKILARRIRARTKEKKVFERKVIALADLSTGFYPQLYKDFIQTFIETTGKKAILIEVSHQNNFYPLYEEEKVGILEETPYLFIKSEKLNKRSWSHWVCKLMEDFSFIFVSIDESHINKLNEIIPESDGVIFFCRRNYPRLKKTSYYIRRLKKIFSFREGEIKTVLIDDKDISFKETKSYLKTSVLGTLPLKENKPLEYASALKRFAKSISNTQLGLVLGSGGALAIAHIGVIQVLEENSIPVDIVCGSSAGALVAGLWALGIPGKKIQEISLKFKRHNPFFSLKDLAFSRFSLLKGRRLEEILNELFGEKTFFDLKMPLRIVCFDFWRKKEAVIKEGKIKEAVRASCSMPGVFSPLVKKGAILLDGGVLHPLPVKPLIQEGIPKIIGVNLSPSAQTVKESISQMKKKSDIIFKVKFNILDFIFGSIETMQAQFIKESSLYADLVLNPQLQDLNWMDFSNVEKLIERGREETLKRLQDIKRIAYS